MFAGNHQPKCLLLCRFTYSGTYGRVHVSVSVYGTYVPMYVCMFISMYVCMCVYMYVCMYVSKYVCMYVCYTLCTNMYVRNLLSLYT